MTICQALSAIENRLENEAQGSDPRKISHALHVAVTALEKMKGIAVYSRPEEGPAQINTPADRALSEIERILNSESP